MSNKRRFYAFRSKSVQFYGYSNRVYTYIFKVKSFYRFILSPPQTSSTGITNSDLFLEYNVTTYFFPSFCSDNKTLAENFARATFISRKLFLTKSRYLWCLKGKKGYFFCFFNPNIPVHCVVSIEFLSICFQLTPLTGVSWTKEATH